MKNKTIGYLMQAPLVLLGIAGFIASAYLAITKSNLIQFPAVTAITFAILVALYFYGAMYLTKD